MPKSKFLPGYKHNYDTLLRAANNGDLALMECTDQTTGELVAVLCAVNFDNGEYAFAPLARMLEGNPYEYLTPPEGETL